MKRPFNFVPDITKIYFTFHNVGNWFYTNTDYSEEFIKRNGYRYDGQVFFKRFKGEAKTK